MRTLANHDAMQRTEADAAAEARNRAVGDDGSMQIPPAPSRSDVEAQIVGVISGQVSRSQADRWAAQWVKDGTNVEDPAVWKALTRLHGVDLTHGRDGPFLHDDEQLKEWLRDLRAGTS
jgi:hypothetical protein